MAFGFCEMVQASTLWVQVEGIIPKGLNAERGWMTHLAKQLDRQMLKHRLDPRNEWHVGSNETFIIGGDRFDE